jgi:hypothetical protein
MPDQIPPTPVTQELITHLSSEITSQTAAMVLWRSRVNFAAYFGPRLVFGGLAAARVKPGLFGLDLPLTTLLAGLAALHISFGLGCAAVERHVWKRCDQKARCLRWESLGRPTVVAEDDVHEARRTAVVARQQVAVGTRIAHQGL